MSRLASSSGGSPDSQPDAHATVGAPRVPPSRRRDAAPPERGHRDIVKRERIKGALPVMAPPAR
jgi:hypothetical protein